MVSKKNFLLLEILIALSLMATMISLLFSFMVQSLRVEKKMEKARFAILERQNLHIRLQDLLTSLSPGNGLPALYSQKFPKEENESLVVFFDNGIDPDPLYSGIVRGRIYIDETHNLCLVYWPLEEEKRRLWRKEILLSNVSKISLQFLGTGEISDMPGHPKPKAVWDLFWPKEKTELPSLIRITLKQKETTLQFAFRLPNANPIPTYWSSSA